MKPCYYWGLYLITIIVSVYHIEKVNITYGIDCCNCNALKYSLLHAACLFGIPVALVKMNFKYNIIWNYLQLVLQSVC